MYDIFPEFQVKFLIRIVFKRKYVYTVYKSRNYYETCLTGSLRLAPSRLPIPGYPERKSNTKPPR